jgi:histidinol-phosphate aminotransferase
MNSNDTLACISANVRNLSAYHLSPEETDIKLNQNENPFDWPREIKAEVADFVLNRPWNRYPDFIPAQLKKALADYAGVSPEQVIAGNGSNEMLLVLLLSCGAASRSVTICQPCFTVYSLLARGLGYREQLVHLTEDLQFDAEAIVAAAQQAPGSLLILNSPNNPVGCALSEREIRRIIEAHQGVCVLDQAYIEFGGFNALPLLSEYPNLIITRTFSKAFAGAGLRLGYMIGAPEVIHEINKIKLPYNINFFSSHVAEVLLRHRELIDGQLQTLVSERERVLRFLSGVTQLRVYPSSANFILVRLAQAKQLFAFLKQNSILVRDVSSYPMLDNCFRISIGSPSENDSLMRCISEYFRNA